MEFLIFLGSGVSLLGLTLIIWIALVKGHKFGTPNWPSVRGEILESEVVSLERETPRGIERSFTPVIQYRYVVDDVDYTSRNRNFLPKSMATTTTRPKADAVVAHYPAGSPVTVYYNPASPGQATLERPRPAAHNAILYYGLTNVVAGFAIIALGVLSLPH